MPATAEIEVVAPNFKSRLSGVTTTIIQLLPLQARRLGIVAFGPGLPASIATIRWPQMPGLLRRPAKRPFRVWHARRNVEMIAGVVLRDILRAPLRLVFTSAAQRNHKPFTKWLIRRMDAVISTSARSGSYLDVPHKVIMHGVDTGRFDPNSPVAAPVLTGCGDRYLVGCFGRIRHQKGTDLFVDAMIALLPRHPQWVAIVTGRITAQNKVFAEALMARIKAAGLERRILFLGEVPDVAPYYRELSLYVAPSRNEGFGLTPLEAMASGTAVVASDAGSYAEMIEPGECGAVVPAGDGEALTAAIGAYMDDPSMAAKHGTNALSHVRAHFPLEKEADEICAVYERLWAAGPARRPSNATPILDNADTGE